MATLTKTFTSVETARTNGSITNPGNAIDGSLSTFAEADISLDLDWCGFISVPEFTGSEIISEIRMVSRGLAETSSSPTNDTCNIFDYASGGSGTFFRSQFNFTAYRNPQTDVRYRMTSAGGWLESNDGVTVYNSTTNAWGANGLTPGTLSINDAAKWRDGLYVENTLAYNGLTGRYTRLYDFKVEFTYTPSNIVRVKDAGVWKNSTPYARDAGVWKEATPYAKDAGVWKPTV